MQFVLFIIGATLGYISARLFASVGLALVLNAVPAIGLALSLAFC